MLICLLMEWKPFMISDVNNRFFLRGLEASGWSNVHIVQRNRCIICKSVEIEDNATSL